MSQAGKKRIVALDVGDARIGVALSDPLGMFAQPLCTIANKQHSVISELLEVLKQNEVGSVVLGLPYELDGSIGEQGKKVEAFQRRLEKALLKNEQLSEIKTFIWDERFTSAQADRVLLGSGLKNSERSAASDRVAAALILESFLNANS